MSGSLPSVTFGSPPSDHPVPSPAAAGDSDAELISLLRARGQRVTSQRLITLRELRRRRRHATADELLSAVSRDLPGMSAPTMYATLDLLVELGLARKIDVGRGVSLFDGRNEPHQHAVCRSCGCVEDIDADASAEALLAEARAQGFCPDRVEVVIAGLCAGCGPKAPEGHLSPEAR
jgi:Fe2+ or Zn2+ uptake regulation protein